MNKIAGYVLVGVTGFVGGAIVAVIVAVEGSKAFESILFNDESE